MKDDDIDDDFDDEAGDEIDETELEVSTKTSSSRPINWRRIEMVREKMRLKKELSDYDV